jgi:hypothetical protein
MGCSDSSSEKKENEPKPEEVIQQSLTNTRRRFEPFLQSKQDPNFNFPEVEEDIFIGSGLKKMKGYISPISKEDLDKKRISFWGTRTEGNEQTWEFLKQVCEMPSEEDENINVMLEAYGLIPYNNCINITYDASGALYEIPNYCINEPYKYEIVENEKEKPKEEKVSFRLKGTHKTKITCSNYETIEKVKQKIGKKYKVEIDKIRLFFYGKELKNDLELWNYNVSNDCVVILMINNNI